MNSRPPPRSRNSRPRRPDRTPPAKTPREHAIEIVARYLETEAFPDRELEKTKGRKAATMEICLGVVRHLATLRWMMNEWVERPPRPAAQACLLCGLYELYFMQTEAYAVLNETVESAHRTLSAGEAGFINALLRKALDLKDDFLARIERLPPPLRLSHPASLWDRWVRAFGEDAAAELCRWNNTPPFVTIRPNVQQTTIGDYLDMLADSRIKPQPHPFDAGFLVMPRGTTPHRLPGYDQGLFTVQDPATALAVRTLAPRPGEYVLDACAAPGGKTLLLEQSMQAEGCIIALDCHHDRTQTLQENLRRAKSRITHAYTLDVRELRPGHPALQNVPPAGFDAILLDVPCSNTGVIRRRPDARWRFNRNRLSELQRTQRTILQAAAKLLRPGGRLLYSTCSLEPEENTDLVNKWLRGAPEFILADSRTLFPPQTGTDGAFVALLQRHE